MTDEQTIRDLVQPLLEVVQRAGPTITRRDARALEGATRGATRAARAALGDQRGEVAEVHARIGFGLLQSFGSRGFASRRDAARLMGLAVDLAASDPQADRLLR